MTLRSMSWMRSSAPVVFLEYEGRFNDVVFPMQCYPSLNKILEPEILLTITTVIFPPGIVLIPNIS
jgi:hypothetical protein